MNTGQNPTNSTALHLPAIVDPETGKIVTRGRLKSPGDLRSAWDSLWWADLESAEFRMKAQQWRDGMSPYSFRKEAIMGTSTRTNVNWGLGDQIASDAEMPYNDLLDGVDTLFSMPTNYGDPSNRLYYEQVMEEEITRMLRGWPRFDPIYQQNVRLFVNEGVSFAFFEDDFGWQWDVLGLQDICFPRRIKADVEQIDIVVAKRYLLPHKLYERCQNEEHAKQEGWNRDATWEAIKTACQQTLSSNDFQQWEAAWKNHDYILGQTAITVEVIEGWVREVDGTVSHYIGRADAEGEFLYKKEGKYRAMSHMLVPFLYGVGANGMFHSIHGVLQKTFAAGMAQNKVFCRWLDMAIHASTPYLQTSTEETLQELPLTPLGQYVAMAPGFDWKEVKLPKFDETLIPIMSQLTSFLNARSGPYTQNVSNTIDKTQRTKYEKQSQDESQARLTSSGVTLFKNGLTSLYREVVRRVIQKPYPQTFVGGPEVQEFISRCRDRGVPEDAIRKVDIKKIEVNMGIGRGSAAARRVAADSLNVLYPRADARGQNVINYMIASSYAGSSVAREVFPPQPGLRPPQDLEDANNENSAICAMASLGIPQSIEVLPTQNHAIHIESHLAHLGRINDGLQAQEIQLEKAVPMMNPIVDHTVQHIEKLDPTNPSRPVYVSQLKQFREVATNGARELYAREQKMMREMQHNAPDGMGGPEGMVNGAPTEFKNTPASMLIQSAQAEQKLNDMRTDAELRQSAHERKEAREDALLAAKIEKMGLDAARVP